MTRTGTENGILILTPIYMVLMLIPFTIFYGINSILDAPFLAACILPFLFLTLGQMSGFNDFAFSMISGHDDASKNIDKINSEAGKSSTTLFKYYVFLHVKMQKIEDNDTSISLRSVPPLKLIGIMIIASTLFYLLKILVYDPYTDVSLYGLLAETLFYLTFGLGFIYSFNLYFVLIYTILNRVIYKEESSKRELDGISCVKCGNALKSAEEFCKNCENAVKSGDNGVQINKSIKCNNCGGTLKDMDSYCEKCGIKV